MSLSGRIWFTRSQGFKGTDRWRIFLLLKRPASLKLALALFRGSSEPKERRDGFCIRTRVGIGEGVFCAAAGKECEAEMRLQF